MAHTDRHNPHWVKIADPFEQRRYAWHDGRNWTWVFWYRDCNCRNYFCSGGWRATENRQHRRDDARRARLAVKGDLDVWDRR